MSDLPTQLREASHFALMDAARGLVCEAADRIELLDDLLAHAMKHAGWIPITQRTPDEPGRYPAWDGISPWYFCDYDDGFHVGRGYGAITHWMPESPDNLDMRLESVPDRLAQEVRRELDRLRWRDKKNRNIIARIKATLEGT